jgi:hypothetical protein
MVKIKFVLIATLLLVANVCNAQKLGFTLPDNKKSVNIPFELYNNLIIIPVTLNHSLTLNFILDTGVQNAILTEKVFSDLLRLKYQRKISISGPGIKDSVDAYISNGITLSLPGGVEANNRSILVLQEDYLNLKNQLGEEVYGIIGHEVFSMFVTKIDYDNKIIKLYNPDHFKPSRRKVKVPITVTKTKPYITSYINYGDSSDSIHLMIDTGASHALLLDPEADSSIVVPPETLFTNLGKGLGGDINGVLGRIPTFNVGKYSFHKVLASFPESGVYNKNIKRGSRSGTIGGELLARLNPTFDYINEYIYIEKSKNFRMPFKHDMSGIFMEAKGPNLELLVITNLKADSPAAKAGLKKNDIISKINGQNVNELGISKVNRVLRSKPGRKIKLKIVRDGELLKKCFELEKFI